MSHTVSPPLPSSSSVVGPPQRMNLLLLLLLLLLLIPPNLVMTSSVTVALRRRGNRVSANICQRSEMPDGGLTVRCGGLRLTQVPVELSNFTIRLFLDKNLLRSLPADSFLDLFLLDELNLSHNQLSSLEAGCFRGLASSLRFLDLSSNRLSTLDPAALGGLHAHANLTHNPWHCDCRMQLLTPQLDLDPSSLAEVVCQTSDLPNLGAVGIPLVLLVEDWDLCRSVRRTTDVVMLVTMFLWFSAVICYLVHYVRKNQEDARRHMEYLKSLQGRQVKEDGASTRGDQEILKDPLQLPQGPLELPQEFVEHPQGPLGSPQSLQTHLKDFQNLFKDSQESLKDSREYLQEPM
ncbi:leucine-rich repeat-containing protein 3B-like [Dicentrarchus labrax]|uniref:leucine-rich repeat-containing protein 3B-like n=1 Tax=Dicentrarchus labrax TaxID=13489 RepID=UPI0021F58589|nr:leucine-rich repeat-containing protein 3B-like [Dicentrarchus labrax]XP_051276063.1 leucine-rich repeat-containing protein 3B-like [Dicentrarchus labrax]